MKVYLRFAAICVMLCIMLSGFALPLSAAETDADNNDAGKKSITLSVGTKNMSFSVDDGTFVITDTLTENEWHSTPPNFDSDQSIKSSTLMNYESQLYIQYADQSGNIYTLSSKAYCVNKHGLSCEKINGGIRAEYAFKKCGVTVPVTFKLTEDKLSVCVEVDKIEENDPAYRLVGISLLPYFNAGGRQDKGFMLVPDGCGALINFNNGKSLYKSYQQYIYGRDMSIDVTAASGHTENALLPVFGLSAPQGSVFAVISEGACRSYISAKVSSDTDCFNSVYSSFIYRDNTMASFNDKSWNKKEVRVFENKIDYQEAFTVDYFLLDSNTDYSKMAACYRDYLKKTDILTGKVEKNYYPMMIDFYGSINAIKHVLGFPVNSEIALTKYSDALDILKDLKQSNIDDIIFKYKNWISGGPESAIPSKFAASGELGGKSGLNKLNKYTEENGIKGYFDVNVTDMYKSRIGFVKTMHSAKMLNQSPAMQFQYSLSTLQKKETEKFSYLLNPVKVSSAVNELAKGYKAGSLTGISCDVLCQKLYSSYNEEGMDRESAEKIWTDSIERLKNVTGEFLCDAPNEYALKFADEITSLPTQSSGYAVTDADVPFYQMVLHGIIPYSMEANNNFGNFRYGILKAVETGSSLKFNWIKRNSDKIDGTQYYTLYSADYTKWAKTASEAYSEISEIMEKVSDTEIVSHRILNENVRETEYANGIKILVNYGKTSVTVDGCEVAGESFSVMGE